MKEEIKRLIELAVSESDPAKSPVGHLGGLSFSVEVPSEKTHGDYSTNVALVLAKKLGENPKEVASEIIAKVNKSLIRANKGIGFDKMEVAGPGFINFFIKDKIFVDNLKNVDKNYGKKANGAERSRRIIIDYTDPNPFKEFHIGHLMNNTIGESLSRIFEFQGARVKRVCYQGDVGIHVAKAIWGKMQDIKLSWGTAYAFGAKAFEEDANPTSPRLRGARKEITELNKKIYNRSDKNINKLYDEGKKESLKRFGEIYKKLGTKFDYFIFESQTGPIGKKIVEKVFSAQGGPASGWEKGDNGAIIFKGEKYGLHTRVFINSEGLPTYEAKDLGLAEIKYKKYKYDESVVVTGNEVNEYFKVMLCAMDKVAPNLAEKTKHIGHGMLRLPEGKMSSRTGKVITGESLIEKVEELVKEKVKDRELTEKEKAEIIENVAIGAIRYSILKQSVGSDIIYDFDKSVSFEGDSGPYLQYSYTRAKSVLRKAKVEKIKPSYKKIPVEITELERAIYYFPEIVAEAQTKLEPHILVLYLTNLAGLFNVYYAKNKIVDRKDELSPYKVALTNAFSIIMKNGMWMLGINSLEKM